MNNLETISNNQSPIIPTSHLKYQCGSCEQNFFEHPQVSVSECPNCFSGNFVEGSIDGTGERAVVADQDICVNCGTRTKDIPRFDYTVEENKENGWDFPEGGYICQECEDESYAEAHLDGNQYCPDHGFIESFFNQKDADGNFVGCYDGCEAAAEYDREVRSKHNKD